LKLKEGRLSRKRPTRLPSQERTFCREAHLNTHDLWLFRPSLATGYAL
jgi:hypothetical protein